MKIGDVIYLEFRKDTSWSLVYIKDRITSFQFSYVILDHNNYFEYDEWIGFEGKFNTIILDLLPYTELLQSTLFEN